MLFLTYIYISTLLSLHQVMYKIYIKHAIYKKTLMSNVLVKRKWFIKRQRDRYIIYKGAEIVLKIKL